MTDKMDNILNMIAEEETSKIDFEALKQGVFEKRKAQIKKRRAITAYASMAASLLIVFGVGTLFMGTMAKSENDSAPMEMYDMELMQDAKADMKTTSIVTDSAESVKEEVAEDNGIYDSVTNSTAAAETKGNARAVIDNYKRIAYEKMENGLKEYYSNGEDNFTVIITYKEGEVSDALVEVGEEETRCTFSSKVAEYEILLPNSTDYDIIDALYELYTQN